MDSFAGHLEGGGRRFWPRVGSADGQRHFRKRTRRGTAMAGQQRHGAQYLVERQWDPDDTSRANKDFFRFAAQALGSFGHGAHRSGMSRGASGAIGIAGIYNNRAHTAFGGA